MKSWTNKVLFFSSNSIFFILLTRSNFFHIHTGNGLEEVLENQETRKKIRSNENNQRTEEKEKKKTKHQTEAKRIFIIIVFPFLLLLLLLLFYLQDDEVMTSDCHLITT